MKYEEISPAMREFIGYFEAFRRLGFRSENIYCIVCASQATGKLAVFAHLEYAGREFNAECGPVADDKVAVATEYKAIWDAITTHTMSPEDEKRLWTESKAYKQAGALAVSLLLKGIELPLADEKPRALN